MKMSKTALNAAVDKMVTEAQMSGLRITNQDIAKQLGLEYLSGSLHDELMEALSSHPKVAHVHQGNTALRMSLRLKIPLSVIRESKEDNRFPPFKHLLGCRWENLCLIPAGTDHLSDEILAIDWKTLSSEGVQAWADVLDALVTGVSCRQMEEDGRHFMAMELDTGDAGRLDDFAKMLAGKGPVDDYKRYMCADDQLPGLIFEGP